MRVHELDLFRSGWWAVVDVVMNFQFP